MHGEMVTETAQIDHKAFLKSLSKEQRLELAATSNKAGLKHLFLYGACIAICSAIIISRIPFWWLVLPVQGVFLVFLFTLMHETIHRTVFANRHLNDSVAWLCGLVLVLPPAWFRYFHFAHHRHTQDPEKDPELASPKPDTAWQFAVHLTGIPVWKSQIITLFRNAFALPEYDYVPASAASEVCREAIIMLVIYAALAVLCFWFASVELIYLWVVPILLGQPFLRLYLLAEHGQCPTLSNMFENSRTTYTSRFIRFLAWNMPFHSEHHAWPAVPFHKLPELHKLTKDHVKTMSPGFVDFGRSYFNAMPYRKDQTL